jgi:hypothetical protein
MAVKSFKLVNFSGYFDSETCYGLNWDLNNIENLFNKIDSEKGGEKFLDYLENEPYPHFEQLDDDIIMINEDGSRKIGRFIERIFIENSQTEKIK